ncbi:DUF4942 domain-containing protein [Curvibacter sp. APW13]|uniref:DUF4942 domain-containing protein n=1 Tax=Curvibacter sp. APW13 TaxID=3077236 RepID=UPI0028DE646C|nr:DUF4942 domain-containing protein [Curvibacter sp. APW13]MDT8992784.1 DUF4942 domain-containing protein [Curvibacter sp. APW13]
MDYQHYPTGEHTAARMWAKFQRPVRHLCDPSAGRGNLIRYARDGFSGLSDEQIPWVAATEDTEISVGRYRERIRTYARQKFANLDEVSAIEIDVQHHPALNELGLKILGYDFMDVRSLATVSHVIMNPPFAYGAAHVLHAWDLVYDAEIAAIINAETIRNPYSQERQRLVKLIEKHGSVEFLQDQFVDDVERTTTVEVALIYLDKTPVRYIDIESMTAGLREGDNQFEAIDAGMCTALALPSNFIEDTCFRFKEAVVAARQASEAQALADRLREGLGMTLEDMQAKGVGNDVRKEIATVRDAANKDFKTRYDDLKKRAWAQIIRSSLLTDKLSNQARKKLEASAQDIYKLEFSAANIHGFLRGVIESMGAIYTDMVCDLFDTIMERSSDNVVFYRSWKSNQKHKIGMRIRKTRFIIPRMRVGFGGGLDYDNERFLADVDKVFGYLHGINGPYMDGLVPALRQAELRRSDRIQSRFFDVRYYSGTQTMHFYPKSAEVVEKINLFVGRIRQWLPHDAQEANEDFQRQYDQGEQLTKEYMEAYRNRRGQDCPAWKLLKEIRGTDDGDHFDLDKFDAAMANIHAAKNIHCGAAIGTNTNKHLPMIALQPHTEPASIPEAQTHFVYDIEPLEMS